MGRRKGFFVKWNEHDNDTVFINKDRVEQYLGPNPKTGIMVTCTILDLGPSWAPVDRQHPYTQTIIPLDTRWANRSPNRSERGLHQPSKPEIVAPDATPDLVSNTPSPKDSPEVSTHSARSSSRSKTVTKTPVQLNWQKIQAACKELIAKKQVARGSWDMVKTAMPTMLEDKQEMPRNRRSSAFACRQHRRSDMGNAARSWRRGGNSETQSSRGTRGIRSTSRAPLPRSNSMRGVRPDRTVKRQSTTDTTE